MASDARVSVVIHSITVDRSYIDMPSRYKRAQIERGWEAFVKHVQECAAHERERAVPELRQASVRTE